MKARRKTFPAIARLSRAARAIMQGAFLEGPGARSVKSIVDDIKAKTGEKVDDNAVYRYQDYWLTCERPFIEARQEADGMMAALKDNPTADVEELVKQRLVVAQMLTAKRFDESDPVELGYLAQGEKRIEVEKEKIGIQRARLEADKERTEVLRAQVKDGGDKATLFIEFMKAFASYLTKKDQEALKHLQPHIRGFAAEIKNG